ncbi:MAG: type IV pilus modification protein PilV [Hydrogenophilales bacterium 28-61-23]|nr:MAG: type IV pilus modification protein PilV [Hydrogenophilales bacterium 28-61-23]
MIRQAKSPVTSLHSLGLQTGFSLLEVLVAMVVLSIGLLGLAALQAVSLNNNQIAYYRSIASQQAYDMADRMRANLAGISAGNYDNLTATLPADPGCIASGTSGCTVLANVAVTDHFQWLTNNAATLPAGSGLVRCVRGPAATCATNDANSNRIFDITVSWTEKTAAGNANQSFVTRFVP